MKLPYRESDHWYNMVSGLAGALQVLRQPFTSPTAHYFNWRCQKLNRRPPTCKADVLPLQSHLLCPLTKDIRSEVWVLQPTCRQPCFSAPFQGKFGGTRKTSGEGMGWTLLGFIFPNWRGMCPKIFWESSKKAKNNKNPVMLLSEEYWCITRLKIQVRL